MEESKVETKNTIFLEPITPTLSSEEYGYLKDQDKDEEGEDNLKIN